MPKSLAGLCLFLAAALGLAACAGQPAAQGEPAAPPAQESTLTLEPAATIEQAATAETPTEAAAPASDPALDLAHLPDVPLIEYPGDSWFQPTPPSQIQLASGKVQLFDFSAVW